MNHTPVRVFAALLLALCMSSCSLFKDKTGTWPIFAVQSTGNVVARTDIDNSLVGGSGDAQVYAIAKSNGIPVLLAKVDGGRVWVKYKAAKYEETIPITQDPLLGPVVEVPHFMAELFPGKAVLPDGRVGETVGDLTIVFVPAAP